MSETAEKKYDIQNTQEVIVLLFKTAKAVKEAKQNDGKIDLADSHLFIGLIPYVSPAIGNINLLPKELSDLDSLEADAILEQVAKEIGTVIDKEKLLAQVNAGLKLLKATYEFAKTF